MAGWTPRDRQEDPLFRLAFSLPADGCFLAVFPVIEAVFLLATLPKRKVPEFLTERGGSRVRRALDPLPSKEELYIDFVPIGRVLSPFSCPLFKAGTATPRVGGLCPRSSLPPCGGPFVPLRSAIQCPEERLEVRPGRPCVPTFPSPLR